MIRAIPLLFLTSCMALSPDGAMTPVTKFEPLAVKREDTTPFKGVLSQDKAVYLALKNNRMLQAAYNELGITEAQLVQSTTPSNPVFSLGQIGNNMAVEVERTLLINILQLLTLPSRINIAETKLKAAQLKAIEEVLRVSAETRRAYITAIASRKTVSYLEEAHNSAKTTSKLFMRLGETGAVNKLDQAREHVFTAELAAKLANARLTHKTDMEKLVRAIGLEENTISVPRDFAAAPAMKSLKHIEQDALNRRIDLQMLKFDVEANAKQAGLVDATKFVNLLEVKGFDILDRDLTSGNKSRKTGAELEFQIPLFDLGQAKSAESRERYMQSLNKLYAKIALVRSEAREAHARFTGTAQIMRHYQKEVLPLRKTIQEQQMLRYNAMLIDILPVLAENRQRITSNIEAINAARDYHLAHSELKTVVIGGGVSNAAIASSSPSSAPQGGH
jgi:outer membrane protein TolC